MEYNQLAGQDDIALTISALKERGVRAVLVSTRQEALEEIKRSIPAVSSVMSGASRTLEEIGFIDYLKSGKHGWNNLKDGILAEQDPQKQKLLRRQAVLSDYYLGSVHAIAKTGQMVVASNSGSQLPHLVYTSPNVILTVGVQKIVPDLDAALRRVREYVLPLEDARMKSVGMKGSAISKLLIFEKEPEMMGRKVTVILINEVLGF
jgi:hypothetical protein